MPRRLAIWLFLIPSANNLFASSASAVTVGPPMRLAVLPGLGNARLDAIPQNVRSYWANTASIPAIA